MLRTRDSPIAATGTTSRRDVSPDINLSPTYGTPVAHFYSRSLGAFIGATAAEAPAPSEARLRGLWLDLYFRPIPPGLSAPITLLSVYLAIITSSLALGHDRIFDGHNTTSVLAIVLGLPAIMSAWVASRFDSKGMRQATPTVILELLSLLTVSLLTVGVAAFKAAPDKDPASKFPLFSGLYGHPWWATVWVLSLAQAILTTITLITRVARYGNAMRRAERLRARIGKRAWRDD